MLARSLVNEHGKGSNLKRSSQGSVPENKIDKLVCDKTVTEKEKRPNFQYKGPICRRIGNALHNLMKYLKECPCDNHVRRHCLITRASKLASNWFTWNVGGIFLALYFCFM